MDVTVAICTWNRSALLRETLDQFTRLRIPPGVSWELLIINNNSTDATDEVPRQTVVVEVGGRRLEVSLPAGFGGSTS